MRIISNSESTNAYRQLPVNSDAVAKNLEKLRSDTRINVTEDDLASQKIATTRMNIAPNTKNSVQSVSSEQNNMKVAESKIKDIDFGSTDVKALEMEKPMLKQITAAKLSASSSSDMTSQLTGMGRTLSLFA
jgi:flagellin-like hook-associated protein FlgL